MSRQHIREMKRSLNGPDAQLARDSALALLERSISFGHPRLAVLRLAMAVHSGAVPTPQHWAYCEKVVQQCSDLTLKGLFSQASSAAAAQ